MNRAFSLVEVLIAVLVLALGLLGLGAVFPAVISEQRRAFDSISGESIASEVEARFRAPGEMLDLSPLRDADFGRVGTLADGDDVGDPVLIGASAEYDYIWVMDQFARIDGGADTPWHGDAAVPGVEGFGDLADGSWRVDTTDNDAGLILPISARLHPLPTSGLDPAFVWDVVARRTPAGPVQIGVFVRRIDDRIRVQPGRTLADMLTGANGADFVLPLALNPANGRLVVPDPNQANQVYPVPQSLDAYAHDDQPTWLIFRNAGGSDLDTSLGFVRRVGQQLLDNTGVVRTVVGLPQPRPNEPLAGLADQAVIVTPPFTPAETSDGRDAPFNATTPEGRAQRGAWVRQIIFTPQTPVAVRVFTLDKE